MTLAVSQPLSMAISQQLSMSISHPLSVAISQPLSVAIPAISAQCLLTHCVQSLNSFCSAAQSRALQQCSTAQLTWGQHSAMKHSPQQGQASTSHCPSKNCERLRWWIVRDLASGILCYLCGSTWLTEGWEWLERHQLL